MLASLHSLNVLASLLLLINLIFIQNRKPIFIKVLDTRVIWFAWFIWINFSGILFIFSWFWIHLETCSATWFSLYVLNTINFSRLVVACICKFSKFIRHRFKIWLINFYRIASYRILFQSRFIHNFILIFQIEYNSFRWHLGTWTNNRSFSLYLLNISNLFNYKINLFATLIRYTLTFLYKLITLTIRTPTLFSILFHKQLIILSILCF